MILTGAGLSAASGVPTFRGKDGFWSKGGLEAQDILTCEYFKENPEENWQWHFDFMKIMQEVEPNVGHYAI